MLLNNSFHELRERALMIDGPPRGRSPVALRKSHRNGNYDKHKQNDNHHEAARAGKKSKSRSRSRSRSRQRLVGLLSYPPYIPIPGVFTTGSQRQSSIPIQTNSKPRNHQHKHVAARLSTRMELIPGSTCQLIMQLMAEYKSIREVIDQLPFECDSDDAAKMVFDSKDIQAIVRRCREYGLTAHTPLQVDVEDWEGEEIEGWWAEDGEEAWRDDPIDVGNEGWWEKLERRENRDWERWRSVSIGARWARKGLRKEEVF